MELEVTQTPPTGPDAPVAAPAQQVVQPVIDQPAQQQPVAQPDLVQQQQENQNQPAPANDEAVSKFVQDAGFDPVELSKQIAASGDITPEAKTALGQKLEKAGLPASMVNEYISGQKAVLDMAVNDIMSVAGGKDGFTEMAEWAKGNLSDAELSAFNTIMTTADINTAKLTVGNLYARYQSSTPAKGRRIQGNTSASAAGSDIFRSWEQQLKAQADPRYGTDGDYRADVEAKIARTLQAGGYHN